MLNPVRLGASSHAFQHKPAASDSMSDGDYDYDSADDLEGTVAEDVVISNKIPESRINFTVNKVPLSTQPQDSPLTEKVNNNNNISNQARNQAYDEQTEAIKNLIYNKSPKEAANEYLAMSRQQMQQQSHFKAQANNKPTNSPLKAKNHPKSISTASAYNKENIIKQEEETEEVDVEDSKAGDYTEVSAYTELANKIFVDKFYNNNQLRPTKVATPANNTNLLLSVSDAQKIEEKRYLASKEHQEDMVNRLMQQGEAMTENSKALTSAYLSKELQECTFAPRIKTAKPRRTLDQFLQDQQEHLLQKEEKTRRLQEEKSRNAKTQEESTFKPSICKGSKKILERKQKSQSQSQEKAQFHQRLHHVGKNAHTKQMQAAAERDSPNLPRDSVDSQFVGRRVATSSSQAQKRASKTVEAPTFKPQIHKKSKNLKRDDRVDNILYNDALRRQHKVIEASKMKSRSTSLPGMSFASKRALAMRFIKEFDIAILEFLEVGKEPKLTYLELIELLRKLCFIKESEHMENTNLTPEKILAYDMWYSLHADKHSGVHRRNLLVFLLGILNLHFPITKIQAHAEQLEEKSSPQEEEQSPLIDEFKNPILPDETNPPYDRKNVGEVDADGNFELNEEEVGKLHKIYNLWYINRMCSGDNLGQLFSTRSQQEFSYHPEINAASQKMAQNYRERILEDTAELIQQNKLAAPKDGKLTHVDLLIVSKKVTEEKVQKYGELLQEEKARELTFKPQTVKYDPSLSASVLRSEQDNDDMESRPTNTRKMNPMPSESMGRDRVFELYSLAKPQILKTDKDKIEADFEKNADECTFQPILYTNKKSNYAAEPKEFYAKGIEKNIERMRLARLEKEHQQKQLERGFTTGNEGHFNFAVDNRKFSNNSLQSIDRRSSVRNYRGTSTSGYRENSESIQEHYNQAQQMRGDEGDRANYYTYEQQMQQYGGGAPTYGIEGGGEEGLGEVQEEENEHEHENENAEDQYEEEGHEEHEEGEEEEEDNQNEEEGSTQQRVPLLFVDVNLGQGKAERIVVYEGDRSDELAQRFADEHGLDVGMRGRLKELLDSQIDGLLSRIDEELNSGLSETERQQHSEQYAHEQIQEEDDYAEEGSYRM